MPAPNGTASLKHNRSQASASPDLAAYCRRAREDTLHRLRQIIIKKEDTI